MAYEPQTWADGEEGGTPITAARLNHMESGISDAADAAETAPAWDEVADKPAVIAAGADQAAARNAIGAGTSNLALGGGSNQAAAGNHTHSAGQITATAVGDGTATDVQGILAELHARIAALEAE